MLPFSLFESVFNSSPIGHFLLSPTPEATILAINDTTLKALSRRREDVVGVSLFVEFPNNPDDPFDNCVAAVRESLARVVATGKPDALRSQRYPIRARTPGGELRYEERFWNAVSTPIFGPDGQLLCISHTTVDVTSRKKVEESLRQSQLRALEAARQAEASEELLKQADLRKDEFLAMLAHELRNPLAPIGAAADVLALGQLDAVQVKQTSAIISRQVRHMTSLVDDLLDVSRVTRGLVTLNNARLDARRIIFGAVEQVRPLMTARGQRLSVRAPSEPAVVLGDAERLIQVMTNLLNNAAKYTPDGGNIDVLMEADGEEVCVRVADDGIGMAPDLVDRAFELFAQAERSPDRSQGGLGIGLALVKSLIGLHGGSVTAYSEGCGKGSRFTVCLPRLPEPEGAAGGRQGVAAQPAAAKALRIMVVDDNADAALMLAMFVRALGHHAVVEHGSRPALARASEEEQDVCLIDIGLPDMDGNELARQLRAQPATASAILVAVTGYGRAQDRQNAFAAGFDYHFVKPVDTFKLASLLGKIGRLL